MSDSEPYRILCLDGGGAKGFYSLGFLREFEAACGQPLSSYFQMIFGTSTGAIIAALVALGNPIEEVLTLYRKHVPSILGAKTPADKSRNLKIVGESLFAKSSWSDFKPYVGIVATNWDLERPLIFKSDIAGAHGMKATFVPGFGQTIADAVRASCSATPFFEPCKLELPSLGVVDVRDGGFSANNPSLFALTDALGAKAFNKSPDSIRLLSLGVGHYPEPKRNILSKLVGKLPSVQLLQKTLDVNSNTTQQLVQYLCTQVPSIRVSDKYQTPEMATDFLEHRIEKLNTLVVRGRESFATREAELKTFFNNYGKN